MQYSYHDYSIVQNLRSAKAAVTCFELQQNIEASDKVHVGNWRDIKMKQVEVRKG